ncbi:MAG: hypothetical protein J0I41_15935 [Filimonas sp.]|nr:hypothetical protein [Filimonas sp.]
MKKIMAGGILLLAAVFIFAGCSSSSKITNSWNAADAKNVPLKKILVLGFFNDKDRSMRARIENEVATDLKGQGYEAVTSFNEYGPKSFENMKEEQALQKLQSANFDGVLTISLLDKNKEKRYVPGTMSYAPYPYYGRFWGYYSYYYPRVYQPGYYETSTRFFFETNLYDINSNKLLYSAQSQSSAPSSLNALADDFSRTIVKDMKKRKVIN